MVFDNYSDFYDLLYSDKDYRAECSLVKRVFETYGEKGIRKVLDLGCGTGSHDLIFADMGYKVTGIDLSERMLQIARDKAKAQNKQISFLQGDIRNFTLPKKFDAILAMFNVLGYLTTDRDIVKALRGVREHLNAGGLFIFDVWFGPAVLSQRPEERTKSIEHRGEKIIRSAHPVLDTNKHTIEVNYTVSEFKEGKNTGKVKESHLVRFFFYQELLDFLEGNGFKVLMICPFLNLDGHPDEHSWNVSVIGRGI